MKCLSIENRLADRFRGCLLALAAGDAVGTAVEFKPRGSFPPVTGINGGGPFGLEPGQWTEETSMALCLASSLLVRDGFDANDQIKRYKKWRDQGYMTSTGECIDVGLTVGNALARYEKTGIAFAGSTKPNSAGNASIMRVAPVAMFYYTDREAVIEFSGESSRTTHGAAECVDACRYLGLVIHRALSGASKEDVLAPGPSDLLGTANIQAIANGEYKTKTEAEIVGSGYVVESLEAALWCFWTTDSCKDAILAAANLGDDADTTAAICGQLAGAFYGAGDIPDEWLDVLVMRDGIVAIADRLLAKSGQYQA
jgi:ADP-ribosyl-[dinitrogen reductase] hydrolase